ncbi:MAG: M24 family metallopeptidase [Candidatus Micrarchaeota archaeon]
MFDYKTRVKRLRRLLADSKCRAFFTGGDYNNNAYYLTGDSTRPSFVLVTPDDVYCFTDFDEPFGMKKPLRDIRKQLKQLFQEDKVKCLAVDERATPVSFGWWLDKQGIRQKPFCEKLFDLRSVKDNQERKAINRAQQVSRLCVDEAVRNPWGKTENELKGLMEFTARKLAGDLNSFRPIVSVSPFNAHPHPAETNNKIARNKTLVLDVGARVDYYCGDYTRTIYEGSDKRIKDAISAVKEAKKVAFKKAKAGVKGKVVSDAAHEVIKEYGFGEYSFRKTGLAIGHAVGLNVHDHLNSLDRVTMRKGNVFAIEPGIYVPHQFGVRFEDLVFV